MLNHDRSRNAATLPVVDALQNSRLVRKAEQIGELAIAAHGGDEIPGFDRGHKAKGKRPVDRLSNKTFTGAVRKTDGLWPVFFCPCKNKLLTLVNGSFTFLPCRTVRPREKQLDDSPQVLQAHPAASLLPLMAPENYEEFKADIAKNGLLEAIWLCDGMILDGRHRYRACIELGIAPHFRTYTGESPVAFVWSLNGQRRHLNRAQLAAVGVNMLPALSEEARKRQAATQLAGRDEHGAPVLASDRADLPSPNAETGKAVEVAARLLGIGATNIRYAKAVKESAPDVFEKLQKGEMTVDTAYKVAKHRAPKATPADPGTKKPDKAERAAVVARMAESGNRANQIAAHLGISEESVAKIAKSAGIRIFSDKTHRINVQRVIEETVNGLAGYAIGLQAIPETLTGISPQQANEWAESIAESMKPLKHLRARLLGVAHG